MRNADSSGQAPTAAKALAAEAIQVGESSDEDLDDKADNTRQLQSDIAQSQVESVRQHFHQGSGRASPPRCPDKSENSVTNWRHRQIRLFLLLVLIRLRLTILLSLFMQSCDPLKNSSKLMTLAQRMHIYSDRTKLQFFTTYGAITKHTLTHLHWI